ncbi:MAG: KH domain-containing protein [Patescibacteria group bacterium]
MNKTKDLLAFVIKSIVSAPEVVKIEDKTDEMGVLLTLHIAREDMGKVIGREGSTAKAIRTIVRVAGMQESARISLKIAEPEKSVMI